MLFHAFWLIYAVKEMDMLNMTNVSKNELDVWWSISVPNTLLQGLYKFRKYFFEYGPVWRQKGRNSFYGQISKEACTHKPKREQEHAHPRVSFGLLKSSASLHRTCSRRTLHFVFDHKICHQISVFGHEGKITLFSFPKNKSYVKAVHAGDSLAPPTDASRSSTVFSEKRYSCIFLL